MKRIFTFILAIAFMAIFCSPSFAAVGVKNQGTTIGAATDINFSTGLEATSDGSTVTVTSGGDSTFDSVEATGTAPLLTLEGERTADAGYQYYATLEGEISGLAAGDKTYGLYIGMSRPATADTTGGDIDDAGLKIRVANLAETNTAGNTMRGFDVQAKNDNPGGAITNLVGGLVSAQTDTSAGNCSVAKALEAYVTGNAAITDELSVGDFRLFRQAATEPTAERVLYLRNSSTTGSGADSAIDIDSDYGSSATTDSFDNGIDLSGAAINKAQVITSSGAKIFTGSAANGDAVYAEVGAYDATGSIYLSTAAGAIYVQKANAGAATDWYKVTATDAD